ncbi:MAG: alpha/beta fold hydrolase [Vicinamibacterales bacterium]
MRPPDRAVATEGQGPDVLFIHGTAADRSSWQRLVPLLSDRVRATTFDRRGTHAWPIAAQEASPRVEDHADDAIDVIGGLAGPVHLCGLSFGAVIALELMQRRPDLVRSAILFEPALSGDHRVPSVPRELLDELARWQRHGSPDPVATTFYRRALGEQMWSALPELARRDMLSRSSQICHDLLANATYQVRYEDLRSSMQPVLLLRGARSRPVFESGLRALHAALPHSRRQTIDRAGHFASEAWPEFAAAVTAFIGA